MFINNIGFLNIVILHVNDNLTMTYQYFNFMLNEHQVSILHKQHLFTSDKRINNIISNNLFRGHDT
ncbi:hypothetical protein V1478_005138 [Vespula squamosa]|uniref:Uncharacterized protein n=1 Tax=Vespula squamosa TaxID=30214 RepID=A0ABD2BDI6_VESSQ